MFVYIVYMCISVHMCAYETSGPLAIRESQAGALYPPLLPVSLLTCLSFATFN